MEDGVPAAFAAMTWGVMFLVVVIAAVIAAVVSYFRRRISVKNAYGPLHPNWNKPIIRERWLSQGSRGTTVVLRGVEFTIWLMSCKEDTAYALDNTMVELELAGDRHVIPHALWTEEIRLCIEEAKAREAQFILSEKARIANGIQTMLAQAAGHNLPSNTSLSPVSDDAGINNGLSRIGAEELQSVLAS